YRPSPAMACSQDGGCPRGWTSCTLVQARRTFAAAEGRSRVQSTNSRPVRWMDGGNTRWPGVQTLFRPVIASRHPAYALDPSSPLHTRRTENGERNDFILEGGPRLSRRIGFPASCGLGRLARAPGRLDEYGCGAVGKLPRPGDVVGVPVRVAQAEGRHAVLCKRL